MSSYILEATNPNIEIMVGWDPGLNTYFAHVIDTVKEEDDPSRTLAWIGTMPDHVHDVDVIVDAVLPYLHNADKMDKWVADIYKDANS
jgi:hypothetical protein